MRATTVTSNGIEVAYETLVSRAVVRSCHVSRALSSLDKLLIYNVADRPAAPSGTRPR